MKKMIAVLSVAAFAGAVALPAAAAQAEADKPAATHMAPAGSPAATGKHASKHSAHKHTTAAKSKKSVKAPDPA